MTRLEQLRADLDTLHTHLAQAQAQASVAYTSVVAAQQESLTRDSINDAAMRGLNATIAERETEIATLNAEIATLRLRIATLEAQLKAAQEQPTKPADPTEPGKPDPKPDPATPRAVIPIAVRNPTPSTPRAAGEYVSASIPLAHSLAVLTSADLAIRDPTTGTLIPGDFRITARWNGLADTASPAQWVIATFPLTAAITGDAVATYELLVGVDGRPALDGHTVLAIRQIILGSIMSSGGPGVAFAVDTGVAGFEIDERGLWAYTVGAGVLDSRVNPRPVTTTFAGKQIETAALTVRHLAVEYAGPLTATVILDGTLPADPSISVRRRYTFFAGSPVAVCTERVAWESTANGNSARRKDGTPNTVLGTLIRERFKAPANVRAIRVLDNHDDVPYDLKPEQGARLAQHLRPKRLIEGKDAKGKAVFTAVAPSYTLTTIAGAVIVSGSEATGGALAIDTATSSVAIALRDFHRYEPQALAYDPTSGELHIDLAADKFHLAHHQGLHATYAIAVSDSTIDLAALWRMLNASLRGLPSVPAYNASGAVAEIPEKWGDLVLKYDKAIDAIITSTLDKRVTEGLQGLMTWGLYPRYWGQWGPGASEIGKTANTWDESYLTGSWTDYWNTTRVAYEWSLVSGNPTFIDSITIPAALRSLHTQSMIAAPTDPYPYAGALPAGYGSYRDDFNSSHQYVENLFAYYHLTGDTTVVTQLERAARVQLKRFRAGEASASGRHPHQWLSVFRFLAYASPSTDINWGDEFDTAMRTAIRNHYVEGKWNGNREAIWTDSPVKPGTKLATSTIYSIGYYDAENLYWFSRRTADAKTPSGVRPSDILARLARTVCTLGFTLAGGTPGDAASKWARGFTATHDGRDTFTTFAAHPLDNQPLLFPDDKPAMASWLARAATISGDPIIARTSRSLVEFAFSRIIGSGVPMGKLMGLCSARLSAAVAEEMKRS